MSISKKVAAETAKQVKQTSAKASKESAADKLQAAVLLEGKQERAKSELSKAFERAENRAAELFNSDCLAKVQEMIASRIELALIQERNLFKQRNINGGFSAEIRVLDSILSKGKEESNGFKVRFSDTENGLTATPATDLHTMFAAAKQSMLKVKIAEREEKAAAAAKEEERKLEVMKEVGITPEQLAALKAAGVIK